MWNTRISLLAAALAAGLCGCGNGSGEAPAQSGTGAAATGATAGAKSGAGGGKLVHVKQSKDECTFEFDAPEEMKESAKDEMSFTLKSASFSFQGYAGSSLYGLDQLAGLSAMSSKEPPVVKETANGVNLVVTRNATPSEPIFGVMGHGEEASYKGREAPLGCSFLCGGTKEREADAIALCKSVRITYDASKAK